MTPTPISVSAITSTQDGTLLDEPYVEVEFVTCDDIFRCVGLTPAQARACAAELLAAAYEVDGQLWNPLEKEVVL